MTSQTSIFVRCLSIAFLALALLPQSTTLFAQTDALAKQPTETWQQFMVRMNQAGQIDAEQLKLWQSGQAIAVPQSTTVTRMRQETRTRTVPVQRNRTETREDGTEVTVPYTENITQNYTVSVPYTEHVVNTVTVPAPGSLPGNAAFDGFVRETPAVQSFSSPQFARPKAPSSEEFQQSTAKKSSENWPAYLARLQAARVLNASQVAQWKKGQPIEVSTNITFQRMRTETRTRQVPVTRMRTETQQNGEETYQVQVPYTENVTQQYQVQVPYTETRQVAISIPAMNTVAANATTSGVSFGSNSAARKKLKKLEGRMRGAGARTAKDRRPKKKASKDVVALMKIRPIQSNAQYDLPDDLGGLRVSNTTKDGSRIQEVKSSKGQTLRQFIDTDGNGEIDHWVYFSNGQQSYCEQDLDGDGKVDQYQYRTGGVVKNGIDEDQDGKIDIWDNGG